MDKITISPKFQVVIPQRIRQDMGLYPGQIVQVFMYNNRIELVPEQNIKEKRGFLQGINTKYNRDEDRF